MKRKESLGQGEDTSTLELLVGAPLIFRCLSERSQQLSSESEE